MSTFSLVFAGLLSFLDNLVSHDFLLSVPSMPIRHGMKGAYPYRNQILFVI